ncbi:MAG: ATP-binding protein [Defluviitaleaceae bacterium]|nr:ATP-binding protein [Defluviitaleaceae bacterium]
MNFDRRNSVLVVDDEASCILVLDEILRCDYTVLTARGGAEAVKKASELKPDIVLLDVMMPDMDGYETIKKLKSGEATKAIPVVFISGLDSSEAEEKGLELGAADYIYKPFKPATVSLRVKNQLEIVNRARDLDERLRQQELMARISHSFLSGECVDALFTETLKTVGEFMDIPQVLLYKTEGDGFKFICQSEWKKPGLGLGTNIGKVIEIKEPAISFVKKMLAGDKKDTYLHSGDPEAYEIIRPYRALFYNYILTPIFVKGEMRAILDFSKENDVTGWSGSEINLAVLVSSIFSGAFERDAMERQFSIVENSPNLVLYLNSCGGVEYANPAAFATTGMTQNELLAEGIGKIFGGETYKKIIDEYIPSALKGETVSFETELFSRSGVKSILQVSIVRTGAEGLGMLTRDLTKIRELEKGLVEAKEQAERSSKVKSEFLSRMSHEMRTPMNTIIGLLQVMKYIPQKTAEYLGEIDAASQKLLGLINDVLDVSSVEYGSFKNVDANFDFNTAITEALRLASLNAVEKRQTFIIEIDPSIPVTLYGDVRRLRQVITNLLANAIKFTPETGEIKFSAKLDSESDGTVKLRFVVTDNGIGIPAGLKEKIFEVFEQADGGISRKYNGIGVGLPLSKRIVEMMGGDIWVESEEGSGATFTFTCALGNPGHQPEKKPKNVFTIRKL